MKRKMLILLSALFILCLMGSMAIAAQQRDEQKSENKQTVCTDPRPQVCTMDYRPVCGERKDGSRKTYSNGCTACSDHEVIGYVEGECKK